MKKLGMILLILVMTSMAFAGCENQVNNTESTQEDVQTDSYYTIDTKAVSEALDNESFVIVDTRLSDAFNGWALDGVSRGGRIQGAVDFSANWLNVEADKKEEILDEALATKGIEVDKEIILYDANMKDAAQVAAYLRSKGFEKLHIYNVNEWADDDSLVMEKFENYQAIVPAVIVNAVINGEKPETFEAAGKITIVEASWGEEDTSYKNGHVPTSFHINTDIIEPPTTTPAWMLADDETLKSFALDYGFNKDDTVIVTGEEQMAAYRVAVVLRYIGVKDVRVLNGGTTAWLSAGYDLETDSNKAEATTDFGGVIPGNPDVIDTIEEIKSNITNTSEFTLLDNRTWEEHIGESSGYTYHDLKGRVPGSVYGYAGKSDSYSLDYFRNIDKTMRNANEFVSMWEEQGIDITKDLSFMCGSGWRAAEIYTYADVYGIDSIGLFSDGWIGWSTDLTNPVETGIPNN